MDFDSIRLSGAAPADAGLRLSLVSDDPAQLFGFRHGLHRADERRHHLQDESGRTFECLASREREAYRIQTKFVQETGTGQMPNDMYMLMLRCDIR
jgi:hypothetical protein